MLALLAERINRASLAARSNVSRQAPPAVRPIRLRSPGQQGGSYVDAAKMDTTGRAGRHHHPGTKAQRLLDSLYQPLCETAQELPADLADISLKLFCFRQQHRVRH